MPIHYHYGYDSDPLVLRRKPCRHNGEVESHMIQSERLCDLPCALVECREWLPIGLFALGRILKKILQKIKLKKVTIVYALAMYLVVGTMELSVETVALRVPVQSDVEGWRVKSRCSFDGLSKRRILCSRDGLDLKDATSFIRRSGVVQFLEKMVFEHRAIMVRAPPASGKTSVAQLLYLHLFESHVDKLPVLLNCLKFDKKKRVEEQFALQSGLKMTMREVLVALEGKDLIIIVDEAQLLYSSIETDIWDNLKSGSADNLFLVFFAAYGEKVRNSETSTPYEFPKAAMFGLKSLLLPRQELEELVTKLCPSLNGFEVAQEQIYHSCEDHIGLVTTFLNEWIDYSKELVQKDDLNKMPLSQKGFYSFCYLRVWRTLFATAEALYWT